MRERQVEQKLIKAVKAAGGICPKLVSPGTDGMPDRLILMRDGKMAFAEVKRPGEKPRPLQKVRISKLKELGYQVFVLDDPDQIPGIIRAIIGGV